MEILTQYKDLLIIISYVIAIISGLYGFYKWILPKIAPYFITQMYLHITGVHVIRDIENHFGKDAGRVLKDIIQQRGLEIVIDEMRLNIIENAVGLGIYICTANGKCTYVNKTLAKMFGLAQSEMLGYGWLGPIVDKSAAYNTWRFSVDNNIPYKDSYTVEVDGTIKKYKTEAEPSYSEDNSTVLGYVGIVKEITK